MATLLKHRSEITDIGIGLTNRCNSNCPGCYSRKLAYRDITLPMIERVIEKYPNVKKINLGTGENILNPFFSEIISHILSKNIQLGITSNGTTINRMDWEQLTLLKDVDVSLDFASEQKHDARRGQGIFKGAIAAIERSKKAGVNTSIAMALMSINYGELPIFKQIIDAYDICLRINIFKPVDPAANNLPLTYDQFWESIRIMANKFQLKSCSEPILSLVIPEMTISKSPCGASIRIHPDLKETSCVYIMGENVSKGSFLKLKMKIPEFCKPCNVVEKCGGGCLGRRILEKRSNEPDKYCPKALNREIPEIKFTYSQDKGDFIHSNYLCTIILR